MTQNALGVQPQGAVTTWRPAFPWWIAFSTSLCLFLAWNCLAGRKERNEEDLSFCLLNLRGWFVFGFVYFVLFCFIWYKIIHSSSIYTVVFCCLFFLCAQESTSLERQDWSSSSCPLLVLMQRVSCTFRKTLLPRLTLCAWRGRSRAGGSLAAWSIPECSLCNSAPKLLIARTIQSLSLNINRLLL